MAREVALVREAAVVRDGGHGERATILFEQLARAVDAEADEVFVRGITGRGFELAREMERAEAGGVGEFLEGERFDEAMAHQLHCAQHGDGWGELGGFPGGEEVELAEQIHGDGAGEAIGDLRRTGGEIELALEHSHQRAHRRIRREVRLVRFLRQCGGAAELGGDALEKPGLEAEDEQLDVAGPMELRGAAGGDEARFAGAEARLDELAIDPRFRVERFGETIDGVLADAAGVADETRSAAPLL